MATQGNSAATLTDVAREAGVSLATASRAINGSTRQVGEDLRERVLEAARKLNYAANTQAQAVAKGRTNIAGLLVHDISDPYFSSIATGVIRSAESHQMLVTLANTGRRPDREVEHLSALRGQHSRVVIVVGSRMADSPYAKALDREVTAFEQTGGRVVMISQDVLPVDTVRLENRAGAHDLAAELVQLGYRHFAILAGPDPLLTARDRVEGFRAGLADESIEIDPANIVHGGFTRDGGYDAMAELLDRGTTIDCVFAANDVMAVGAMTACRERGIDLPGEIGMAGFDDISTLRDVSPALTTVRLPLEKAGSVALELALDAAPGEPPRVRSIAGEVVIRQSTPPRERVDGG
ncbi:LacI family DNA-binding transcriptional regulator [Phytoactinopolyspora mesophila]|uniref:LacI family DNA-binding transcriptional regulator n=1 Tax=Phytoactinopolyspora mesophila TaxID=2650750 RepID=A0A7K3M0U6_9ACTN|nr:LacI family DNA-binding transcriptional regulator [Phytoactinopolyspora mesophila]NDL56921.1 LacI family DNA-binding transcriptional regulator [Phytoactinopolyspora mesophila]